MGRLLHTAFVAIAILYIVPAYSASLPRAKIKESVICCPQELVTLDGWASIAPGGEIAAWDWDLNGDGKVDTTCSIGELTFLSPPYPKTYHVILWVRDKSNNQSKADSSMLSVMKSEPRVAIQGDTIVKVGTRISFTPQVSINCGFIVKYEWDLDDDGVYEYQSTETGKTSKAYFKAGRYKIRFRTFDNLGHEAGALQIIHVKQLLPKSESHAG